MAIFVGAEGVEHGEGLIAHRRQAHHINQPVHRRQLITQVVNVAAHGLNTVQHEHLLILLRQHAAPVRVLDTAGLALILWLIFRTSSKAARGVGQRQMAVAQHFHLKLIADAQLFALIQQIHQPVARKLHRHTPAHHPLFLQYLQGNGVVAVQRVTGDKRQFAFGAEVHYPKVARFQQKLAVVDVALQLAQLGGCLHQRQRRDHHLLAAVREGFSHIQPVAHFGGATLAAYRFTEINGIGVARGGLLVKVFQRLF